MPVAVVAEDRGEARARVEAGDAQPVDRAVVGDQRRGLGVADQRVLLDPGRHSPSHSPFEGTVRDLDEGEAELGQRVPEGFVVGGEAGAQAVDQGREGVDREPGFVEAGLRGLAVGAGIRGEVQHRELPEADRVVGHDVGHRHRGQLGPGPEHLGLDLGDLLGGELLVVVRRRCRRPARQGRAPGRIARWIGRVLA